MSETASRTLQVRCYSASAVGVWPIFDRTNEEAVIGNVHLDLAVFLGVDLCQPFRRQRESRSLQFYELAHRSVLSYLVLAWQSVLAIVAKK